MYDDTNDSTNQHSAKGNRAIPSVSASEDNLNTPANNDQELFLTFLLSGGKQPTKTVRIDPVDGKVKTVEPFPYVFLWQPHVARVPFDIDALHAAIKAYADRQEYILISGEPIDPVTPESAPAGINATTLRRRTKHKSKNKKTGEIDGEQFRECAGAWVALDVDKVPASEPLDPFEPENVVQEIVGKLGGEFSDASYVWQLTSSADPTSKIVSIRLYFLVDRPITNEQRKRFANAFNRDAGIKFLDPAIYNAAHPIYIAPPKFDAGTDPFPRRMGVIYGEREALDWGAIESKLPTIESKSSGYRGAGGYSTAVSGSIEDRLAAIGDHPGGAGCHNPIRDAIMSMVRERWDEARIIGAIQERVQAAHWAPGRDWSYIASKISESAIKASIAGAATRIEVSAKPLRSRQTYEDRPEVPLDVARGKIAQDVSRWCSGESKPVMVVRSTVGIGKTHAVVEALRGKSVHWFSPNHSQAREVCAKFNSLDGVVETPAVAPVDPSAGTDLGVEFNAADHYEAARVIGGRLADSGDRDAGGRPIPLCSRPQVLRAIDRARLSHLISQIACEREGAQCPFKKDGTCKYYRQFWDTPPIKILPHVYLNFDSARALEVPEEYQDRFAGYVIDESPLGTLVGHGFKTLAKVLENGGVLGHFLMSFRDGAEIDCDEMHGLLTQEKEDLCKSEIPIHQPSEQDEGYLIHELEHIAQKYDENSGRGLERLYDAAIEYASGNKNVLWMGVDREGNPAIHFSWKKLPAGVMAQFESLRTRVLILDATADEQVYRALFGDDIEFVDIRVKQNLEITRVFDKPCGKEHLSSADHDKSLLPSVLALARGTGSALITHKDGIEAAAKKGWLGDMPYGSFGALRGMNHMEKCDSLVIAGRTEPDALHVEAVARALWPDADLTLTGAYEGRVDGNSSVWCHPDERIDSVLRMHREAEIEQAIGRIRAVSSESRKRVYLVTNCPIEHKADREVTLDQMLPDPKLARVLLAFSGVAPLNPRILAERLPEIWGTAKAAERWLEERQKTPQTTYIEPIYKGFGGFSDLFGSIRISTFEFRAEKQRGLNAKGIAWTADPDVIARRLERHLERAITTLEVKPGIDAFAEPDAIYETEPVTEAEVIQTVTDEVPVMSVNLKQFIKTDQPQTEVAPEQVEARTYPYVDENGDEWEPLPWNPTEIVKINKNRKRPVVVAPPPPGFTEMLVRCLVEGEDVQNVVDVVSNWACNPKPLRDAHGNVVYAR